MVNTEHIGDILIVCGVQAKLIDTNIAECFELIIAYS